MRAGGLFHSGADTARGSSSITGRSGSPESRSCSRPSIPSPAMTAGAGIRTMHSRSPASLRSFSTLDRVDGGPDPLLRWPWGHMFRPRGSGQGHQNISGGRRRLTPGLAATFIPFSNPRDEEQITSGATGGLERGKDDRNGNILFTCTPAATMGRERWQRIDRTS
jgi:hypothetical protein